MPTPTLQTGPLLRPAPLTHLTAVTQVIRLAFQLALKIQPDEPLKQRVTEIVGESCITENQNLPVLPFTLSTHLPEPLRSGATEKQQLRNLRLKRELTMLLTMYTIDLSITHIHGWKIWTEKETDHEGNSIVHNQVQYLTHFAPMVIEKIGPALLYRCWLSD